MFISSPNTLTEATTPRYESKNESKINAFVSSVFCAGGLTNEGIASNSSLTPSPVFADISNISFSLEPIKLKICFFAESLSASIESILFSTGITSRPASIAAYECANVWACIPCVASTSRIAPSHAIKALETSYEKSTWPGVSIKLRVALSNFKRMGWDFIVIPFSRSSSILSNIWSKCSPGFIRPDISINLSANVDLPWSTWAIIEIFLIFLLSNIFIKLISYIPKGFTWLILIHKKRE